MTYLTEALTRLIPAVRAIETDVPDAPDLLAAAIHQIERHDDERDRLVRDLAIALGQPLAVVRLSQGLDPAEPRQKPVSADERP